MSRIRDIANLFSANTSAATDSEVTAAISAHNSSTTTVHGISDTSALATSTSVASDISAHNTTANGHVKRGNTASRPASPATGDIYMNTQLGYPEFYEGTAWVPIGADPSEPTSVVATNSGSGRAYNNGQASVAFTAGTVPGSTYTITSDPGSYYNTGSSSPILVEGLQSNTSYTFTATASNVYGTSAASSASSAITATTVPQAPTIGTATNPSTGETISVTFSANATGGSTITSYTAISNPGNITASGSSSPISVTGLTNGTSYTFTVTANNANGSSSASSASNSVTPSNTFPVDFLVVAGGGGGGPGDVISGGFNGNRGGGGGAGGLRTSYGTSGRNSAAESKINVSVGQTYTVIVGAGGSGYQDSPTNGADSYIQLNSTDIIRSLGGGLAEGLAHNPFRWIQAGNGGCGGGASEAIGTVGQGTAGQGYNGGAGNQNQGAGGGGGGAGSEGVGAPNNYSGGAGGSGLASTITGSSVTYSGGGGGNGSSNGGGAGSGGGGAGSGGNSNGGSGSTNTGGGGGGGITSGGNGGSGIIVIRLGRAAASTTGSPTYTTSGSDHIYKFTGNGSITF